MAIRSHVFLAGLLVTAAAACGGGKKPAPMLPDESGDSDEQGPPPGVVESGENMVPPETADDIQRRFERKRGTISRCLSAAVDAKELPKNSRGKITLNVVIMPGGKAGDIKVVKATIESERLTSCVIGKVREIAFPDVPKAYPTSYTYAFEAM
jgi:hypothetical protein